MDALSVHPDYYRHVIVTPTRLIHFDGVSVWLKDETAQISGSFKFRGALNVVLQVPPESSFVTASTGNHAAGMAFASRVTGSEVTVVVPTSTPVMKSEKVRAAGAIVVEHGADYEASRRFAVDLARSTGSIYVPSFDDSRIISGHAPMFDEAVMAGAGAVDATFVPVGGGGLLAAALTVAPGEVVGVELDASPAMSRSLAAGFRVPIQTDSSLYEGGVTAEGLIVTEVGSITFEVAKSYDAHLTTVTVQELINAMSWCWDNAGVRVEASAAASVAAMLRAIEGKEVERPRSVLCVLSGGNIDAKVWSRAVGRVQRKAV